MEIVESD